MPTTPDLIPTFPATPDVQLAVMLRGESNLVTSDTVEAVRRYSHLKRHAPEGTPIGIALLVPIDEGSALLAAAVASVERIDAAARSSLHGHPNPVDVTIVNRPRDFV